MSKVDIDDVSSDYEDWTDDMAEEGRSKRQKRRERNLSEQDMDDTDWDDEPPAKKKGRRAFDRRRDIEDRLEQRRLEREIGSGYEYDFI